MLFNVYDFSNQIIGQVEASDIVEAWSEAGEKYENVLDVREVRGIGEEAFPNGLRILKNIKDDPSIRMEILRIRNTPEVQVIKQTMWLDYLKYQYERGLLTTEEYSILKDWDITIAEREE